MKSSEGSEELGERGEMVWSLVGRTFHTNSTCKGPGDGNK